MARKIEKEMLEALHARKSWNSGNTAVVFKGEALALSEVYLHGNHIANYDHEKASPVVDLATLREHPTVTTKSRLRALGADVRTKKGEIYVNGVLL